MFFQILEAFLLFFVWLKKRSTDTENDIRHVRSNDTTNTVPVGAWGL